MVARLLGPVWLGRLSGVGRKVAASMLDASTLRLLLFICDTHVQRVLQIPGSFPEAGYRAAGEPVTADRSGDDFLRLRILTERLCQTVCRRDAPERRSARSRTAAGRSQGRRRQPAGSGR